MICSLGNHDRTPRELNGRDHPTRDNGDGQLAVSELTLGPEEVLGAGQDGADLILECYASHPALGSDFMAYAHVVEILCKCNLRSKYDISGYEATSYRNDNLS